MKLNKPFASIEVTHEVHIKRVIRRINFRQGMNLVNFLDSFSDIPNHSTVDDFGQYDEPDSNYGYIEFHEESIV